MSRENKTCEMNLLQADPLSLCFIYGITICRTKISNEIFGILRKRINSSNQLDIPRYAKQIGTQRVNGSRVPWYPLFSNAHMPLNENT